MLPLLKNILVANTLALFDKMFKIDKKYVVKCQLYRLCTYQYNIIVIG